MSNTELSKQILCNYIRMGNGDKELECMNRLILLSAVQSKSSQYASEENRYLVRQSYNILLAQQFKPLKQQPYKFGMKMKTAQAQAVNQNPTQIQQGLIEPFHSSKRKADYNLPPAKKMIIKSKGVDAENAFKPAFLLFNKKDANENKKEANEKPDGGQKKKFVPPCKADKGNASATLTTAVLKQSAKTNKVYDEKYKNLDAKLIEQIEGEILQISNFTDWNDIAGLKFAKDTVNEMIIWPLLRPDLFVGKLRNPPKALLLFGPPGTGKTMIGKAIASEAKATFFNISSSIISSKWVGESEKLVKTLFEVARIKQPSVIFLDEIDSMLCSRSDNDHESSRKIKTEFLVHFDGVSTNSSDHIIIIGATNRPQDLDDAVRRRFIKRLYIPLPNAQARAQYLKNMIEKENAGAVKLSLNESEVDSIVKDTKGFSGADLKSLCSEAALNPLRNLKDITTISSDLLKEITIKDFKDAIKKVKPTVSSKDLAGYLEWNNDFGCFPIQQEDIDN